MTQVLNIPLQEKTLKKLRALAMLSDIKVSDLEAEISVMIDQMLTDNIGRKMSELDGTSNQVAWSRPVEIQTEEPVVETKSEPTQTDDPNAHGLSEDDAEEEVLPLAEQIAKDGLIAKQVPTEVIPAEDAVFKVEIDAPVVGNNGEDAEAFIEEVAAPPRKRKVVSTQFGPASSANGFNPQQPLARVRVSDFTGDEGDDQNWFKI